MSIYWHAPRDGGCREVIISVSDNVPLVRRLSEFTNDEWDALRNDFADLVLQRHRVSGSVAGVYSLYTALDDERDRARRAEGTTMQECRVEFFKDGDRMGVRTSATTADEFLREVATVLGALIDSGEHQDDWEFQLFYWLPQVCEIVAKLKGYKADVEESRILYAGASFSDHVEPVAKSGPFVIRSVSNSATKVEASPSA
jgi:hypothetical protein